MTISIRKVGRPRKTDDLISHEDELVCKRLDVILDVLDLTQQEAAEKLGIKQNNVSRIVLAKNAPSLSLLRKILTAFNVNPNWLILGEGEMFKNVSVGQGRLIDKNELNLLSNQLSKITDRLNLLTKKDEPEFTSEKQLN